MATTNGTNGTNHFAILNQITEEGEQIKVYPEFLQQIKVPAQPIPPVIVPPVTMPTIITNIGLSK